MSLAEVLAGLRSWHIEEGDCLDVLRGLPEASVDAVVTDPPYGIGGVVVRTAGRVIEKLPVWDAESLEWVPNAVRLLRPGGSFVSFCDTCGVGRLRESLEAAGLRFRHTAFWVKHAVPPNPRSNFQSSVEVAGVASRGAFAWQGGGLEPNVWFGNIVKANRLHPTQKPLDLMRWLCRLVTPPGGLILDPFAGSGTTVVAALREGFRCIGVEREPEYVEIARRRVEEDAPLFQRVPA